jgi:hypothetical protein
MSTRHRRTLEAVFRDPVSATIVWNDVEKMLVHYGATIEEREGSAIAVVLGGHPAVFHRPHPAKEAQRYLIRNVRDLLTQAGLKP